MSPTDEQLRILRHMLGIDRPEEKDPTPYRNYYCASREAAALQELAELGLVEKFATGRHYDWYRCTELGKAAALASHRRIRLPKSARLYRRFLRLRDVLPGLTFREFLTCADYAEVRHDA